MKNQPAAILIGIVEDNCFTLQCDEEQRLAYVCDGIISDAMIGTVQAIPYGFEVRAIFVDLLADGKPTITLVEKL